MMNNERFMGFADTYEQTRPTLPKHAIELIKNYLTFPLDTVVDLGCGTGLSTLSWKGETERIIGIEPSIDMLSIAKQKESKNITFLEGYSTSIPLEDESVDVVICSQSFHWMEPFATLKEVNRILKPGGVFAALDYDWPGVVDYQAEKAIYEIRAFVRSIESVDTKEAHGYPKNQHIPNMNATGYFDYTREIVFSNQEICTPERLINMIGSISSFQREAKRQPEVFNPEFEKFTRRIHEIYHEPFIIEFGYRLRIGVKRKQQ